MNQRTSTALILLTAIVCCGGCQRDAGPRYYLQTQKTPDGTITSLMDAQTNTQLLYIDDLGEEDPSISVLPVSREGISSVSVGPYSESVLVVHRVEKERTLHAVMVNEIGRSANLSNTDYDNDGIADMRSVGFPTELGRTLYFDLDANGVLDGQFAAASGGETDRTSRILVEQCWVTVEDSTKVFSPPFTATTLDTPPSRYQFKDGAWRESTEMGTE